MFVTIVVFLDTLALIVSSCILISKCQKGLKFLLKVLHIFVVSYQALSFLTQFQGSSNSFVLQQSYQDTCLFIFTTKDLCCVGDEESLDLIVFLFVLCFNSFYLKQYFHALLLLCFQNHAFMHCIVFVFIYFCIGIFYFFYCFQEKKIKIKN